MDDNTSSIISQKVTFFENIYSHNPVAVKMSAVLAGIKNGRWKGLVEKGEKKELPSVYFSGIFTDSDMDSMEVYSGLFVLDFDKIGSVLSKLREKMFKDPYLIAYFNSPSGNGLKVIMMVNTDMYCHKELAFPYLQEYIKNRYGLTIDEKCKNINRHCFVSYDPQLVLKSRYKVMIIPSEYTPKQAYVPRYYANMEVTYDVSYIFKKLVDWENEKHRYIKGNRNEFVFRLICQCNRYGIVQEMTYGLITTRYPSFSLKELNSSLTSHYTRFSGDFSSRQMKIATNNQEKFKI